MRTRFFFMTLLISILIAAWIVQEYQYEQARQEKYRQLSELPVYIYVSDSTRVAPLLERLAEFPAISELNLETGLQAADELIRAYQLAISFSSIQEYEFPYIITLKFKAIKQSVETKPTVMRAIAEQQIQLADIDAQSKAWSQVESELNTLNNRWIMFTINNSLLLGLLFFFLRFSYEMHFLLLQKRRLVSVADALKMSTEHHRHTWIMLLSPLILCVGGYFVLSFLDQISNLIPLWWFSIPAGVMLVSTLAIILILNVFLHDQRFLPQEKETQDDS